MSLYAYEPACLSVFVSVRDNYLVCLDVAAEIFPCLSLAGASSGQRELLCLACMVTNSTINQTQCLWHKCLLLSASKGEGGAIMFWCVCHHNQLNLKVHKNAYVWIHIQLILCRCLV